MSGPLNDGPHSGAAWLSVLGVLVLIGLFHTPFLGFIIGAVLSVGLAFAIFKAIGGDGGLFK